MRLYTVARSAPGSGVNTKMPLGCGFMLCSRAPNGSRFTDALSTACRVISGTNRNGTPHEMTCTGVVAAVTADG